MLMVKNIQSPNCAVNTESAMLVIAHENPNMPAFLQDQDKLRLGK